MSRRAGLVIAIYVLLGLVLAATGFLLSWGGNTGLLAESFEIRLSYIVVGFILMFIGVHIAIAGVRSLRRTAG
ncbi:MAG: hypothetical protein RMI56_04420 [Sulfolobales archaeon]|nr:hypothetical protein [Sulfolobales archaeon]MDW8083028.1 hypothetical protein [Sulfolobales archaeon]